ncbi:MAG TPA: thiamine pyrophosphate-dependent enzyme, partial [Methanocorpusculum sp.]|nr:thiamine pyrophosphate-dependent enzyme [Methanocorpusculum sp.]
EQPFDLCSLAIAAGANYVARWTSYHVKQLISAIQTGLETPGLSFIEVYAQCPTAFGAKNKMKLASQMIDNMREYAVLKKKADADAAAGIPPAPGSFVVGEFVRRNNPALGVLPEVKQ